MRMVALSLAVPFLGVGPSLAQMDVASPARPTGVQLFRQQCATCHATNTTDAQRQGPSLAGVVGRKAGTLQGFKYSQALAGADFVWDDERLNAWLTNPQSVIPGAIMPYRQANADIRAAIIGYLRELR